MSICIAGRIKHETDKAILFADHQSEEDVWLPLSQVDEIHREFDTHGSDRLVISDWIARQKGLREVSADTLVAAHKRNALNPAIPDHTTRGDEEYSDDAIPF